LFNKGNVIAAGLGVHNLMLTTLQPHLSKAK